MWIFTPFGFFSIVEHRGNANRLLVRARAEEDALHFHAFVHDASDGQADCGPVFDTPRADYPFRFEASREAVGRALQVFVGEDLEYDNFKNEVAKQPGGIERASVYHDVWHVLREGIQKPAQRDRARRRDGAPR